jgi:hypothetical protein
VTQGGLHFPDVGAAVEHVAGAGVSETVAGVLDPGAVHGPADQGGEVFGLDRFRRLQVRADEPAGVRRVLAEVAADGVDCLIGDRQHPLVAALTFADDEQLVVQVEMSPSSSPATSWALSISCTIRLMIARSRLSLAASSAEATWAAGRARGTARGTWMLWMLLGAGFLRALQSLQGGAGAQVRGGAITRTCLPQQRRPGQRRDDPDLLLEMPTAVKHSGTLSIPPATDCVTGYFRGPAGAMTRLV